MKNKIKVLKICNIIEPIIFIVSFIGLYLTVAFALSNVSWVSLGETVRDWYWYESLIMNMTWIMPLGIVIFEIYMFFKLNTKFKICKIIYIVFCLPFVLIVWYKYAAMCLIVIFVFNLIECIFRFINMEKILKKGKICEKENIID